MVECDLAKVEVAGSNPVSRSNLRSGTQVEVAHHSGKGATVGRTLWGTSYGWQATLRVDARRVTEEIMHTNSGFSVRC